MLITFDTDNASDCAKVAELLGINDRALREPMTWDTLPGITRHILREEGISTIAELAERSPVDLLKLPNFGNKSLKAVEQLLDEHGLTLWTKRKT
ncbi:DNA-directed RNA polymerase subunit alpha C-terminal domain-containing protein [uncultured Thiodictyon sp.]|uniref:DNA-directed RNA polymerase subunit alpha C-terminal domain-containing protein n=1 Tax=uncultured Thiodictyon sp. TaxID=1846217 RepID=UPI0034289EDB